MLVAPEMQSGGKTKGIRLILKGDLVVEEAKIKRSQQRKRG